MVFASKIRIISKDSVNIIHFRRLRAAVLPFIQLFVPAAKTIVRPIRNNYTWRLVMAHINEAGVKKICEICDRYAKEKTPLMMILSD